MKKRITVRIFFILLVLSMFTPWFTYRPDIMGYCWGFYFLKWLAVPIILVGVSLFSNKQRIWHFFLTEVCFLATTAIYMIVFGRWQETCNIIAGYHWIDGFHTAQPGYWISAVFLIITWMIYGTQSVMFFSNSRQ